MEKLLLTATERKEFGKGAMYRLRREGKIPAVVYGQKEPLHITLNEKDFLDKFRHISDRTIVPMEINGKKIEILVKEYQHDIVRDKILHIDFYDLVRTPNVKASVPVKFNGTAIGLREGGALAVKMDKVEVECMARFIPKLIEVNVDSLKLGDTLTVSSVKAPENVKFTTKADTVLVAVEPAN